MSVFEKILERLKETKELYVKLQLGTNRNSEIIAYCGKEQAIDIAISIVKEAEKEYNNGWIPCSERMPERNKDVLCWVKSKSISCGETYIIGSCNNGFWFLKTYEIDRESFPVKDYEVVAWQQLPEPYKESDKE